MSKIALEMLRDINKNTVDFTDNYDASEREPNVLPARFPNLLVNGATGIAVGMATNIPPHNLGESIDAVKLMMDNPDVTTRELMEVLPGPDFPTGALVMGNQVFIRPMKQERAQLSYVLVRRLKRPKQGANALSLQNSLIWSIKLKCMNTSFAWFKKNELMELRQFEMSPNREGGSFRH